MSVSEEGLSLRSFKDHLYKTLLDSKVNFCVSGENKALIQASSVRRTMNLAFSNLVLLACVFFNPPIPNSAISFDLSISPCLSLWLHTFVIC